MNLFSDKYSNQITREFAEKTIIKDSDIYKKNENEDDTENKKEIDNKKDNDKQFSLKFNFNFPFFSSSNSKSLYNLINSSINSLLSGFLFFL